MTGRSSFLYTVHGQQQKHYWPPKLFPNNTLGQQFYPDSGNMPDYILDI